ncbi:MAG: VOC family protein [Gammaproteobacteria bacterium]|nr:VOC family protein [Gammaproteobacteria bacterium]
MSSVSGSAVAILDHVVFNTRYRMDEAERLFAALGFTLTPRGYHSLGSINHLTVFDTNYLELLGLPDPDSTARPELANAPEGLNGLVFKTDDVDATYSHLQRIGLAGDPPKAFSRPVEIDGRSQEARFRTVHVRPDRFPGRVYFCEHATPELVWRPDWQRHENGVHSIAEFVVVAGQPEVEARDYAALVGGQVREDSGDRVVDVGDSLIRVCSPQALALRHPGSAVSLDKQDSLFAAVVLRADLARARRCVEAAGDGIEFTLEADRVVARIPSLDYLIVFSA